MLVKSKIAELEEKNLKYAHSILLALKNYRWIFIHDAELVQLTDEFSFVKGENIQVAIRRNQIIQVNFKVFNELNDRNKAALVFHEIVSALSPDNKADLAKENSKARQMVGAIFNYEMMTSNEELLSNMIWETVPSSMDYDLDYLVKSYMNGNDVLYQPVVFVNYIGSSSESIFTLNELLDDGFTNKVCKQLTPSTSSLKLSLKPNNSTVHFLKFQQKDYSFTWRDYESSYPQKGNNKGFDLITYEKYSEIQKNKTVKEITGECAEYERGFLKKKCVKYKTKEVQVYSQNVQSQNCQKEVLKLKNKYKEILTNKIYFY